MPPLRRSLAVIVLLAGSVPIGSVAAQRADVPALHAKERFVQHAGLHVSLEMPEVTLHVGQDPKFRLRFENGGSRRLFLSPHVPTNLYITTIDGLPVRPSREGIAEKIAPPWITARDLVSLDPGRAWTTETAPMHASEPREAVGQYAEHGFTQASGWALLLPPGEYVARFVYISAPGYGSVYDVYDMPDGIWEGRQDTSPISFTVVAPTPAQLKQDEARIQNPKSPWVRTTLSLFALPPAALIDRFKKDESVREDALAIVRYYHPALWRDVLSAVGELSLSERQGFIYSDALWRLLREYADCGTLEFVIGQLPPIRSDLWWSLAPVFEKAAPACPAARLRLREMVTDDRLDPYARSNAAALLGTFKNAEDIPLLTDALDWNAPAGTPAWGRDVVPKGAAAGLAMHDSSAARAALSEALLNDRRAKRIGAGPVNRLGDVEGPEITRTLVSALRSQHSEIVSAAIGALYRRRELTAADDIAGLLNHANTNVRRAAADALRALGAPGFAAQMRVAARDPDQNLQAVALHYLANYGDRSDLDLFLSRMESRHQYVGEAARIGVARFGTEASARHLRGLLGVPHGRVHQNVQAALRHLTFVNFMADDSVRAWDAWFAKRRGTTRLDWAREAIEELGRAGPMPNRPSRSIAAVSYLADAGVSRYRADFERAARSRDPELRISAARALARIDRPWAARLLIREFDSRLPGACWSAHALLNELAGRTTDEVSCEDPGERRRLRAMWIGETARW
jgi:HEAT repeat protein